MCNDNNIDNDEFCSVSLLSFNPFHDYWSLSISPENIRKEVFLMFSKDIGKDQ